MSYKIAVCIKPIPDPKYYNEINIDPIKKTIKREGIPTIINPEDKNAIEEALKIKEKYGGIIKLISMAPYNAEINLREGLAMGADEAYLLSDKKFAGADTLATAYVLAKGIEAIGGADIILTGSQTGDGATSQVPSQLGEWLKIPHLWGVVKCSIENNKINIKTKMENGYMEWLGTIPIVLAVSREINNPRLTSIMGIIKAKNKPIKVLSSHNLVLDESFIGLNGSPTKAGSLFYPDIKRKCSIIRGSKEELVQFLTEKIKAHGINVNEYNYDCEMGASKI